MALSVDQPQTPCNRAETVQLEILCAREIDISSILLNTSSANILGERYLVYRDLKAGQMKNHHFATRTNCRNPLSSLRNLFYFPS